MKGIGSTDVMTVVISMAVKTFLQMSLGRARRGKNHFRNHKSKPLHTRFVAL